MPRADKESHMKEKAVPRTGDFEEERLRIVEEYASGSYLKTSADLVREEEQAHKKAEFKDGICS